MNVLLTLALLVSAAMAQVKPGFEPQDVVQHVRSSHSTGPLDHSATGLDDGEFLIDTSPVYTTAYAMQWYCSVAYGGGNYLVVWQDWRNDYPNYIYCARVSPTGVVLDPAGIAIAPTLEQYNSTAVAFDGTNFMVVWEDERDTSAMDIYGARVSPGGAVLDPGGFPISMSQGNQHNPAVAFRSPNFLVVWDDQRVGTYGARVTPAGAVLDPDGISIAASSEHWGPGVAAGSSEFLVVWERYADDKHIYGTRVDSAGIVLDPDGIRISLEEEFQQSPAVAFDGANYLVVWLGWTDHDLRGARVTPEGVVLDTAGIAVATSANWDLRPAVTFADTVFMAVWYDDRDGHDVLCARVTSAGTPLDPDGILLTTKSAWESNDRIASDGTGFFAVWAGEGSHYSYDIHGARVSESGVVLDSGGFAVSTAAGQQVAPAVASDSTDFLVTWEEERGGVVDIYGARVNAAGGVLDPQGFAISFSGDTESRPAIAFGGNNYLVVWGQYTREPDCDIYGARVSRDGIVLDTHAIAISIAEHRQRLPAVAFNGTDFMVVWEDWRDSVELYGARVSCDGIVLDTDGIRVASTNSGSKTPDVASDGTNSLVIWNDERNVDLDVYGARVSPSGFVLDPGGIRICSAMYTQSAPKAAFDGTNFFVAWSDGRSGEDYDLRGARVNPAGILIDTFGIPISTAAENQDYPDVEFDGTNLLCVWRDRRDSRAPDLYGAFVSPGGSVFGGGAVVVAPGFQSGPALARGSGGQVFLAYQGWTGTVGGKPYNSDRIWGKLDPHPGIEEVENGEVRRVKGEATIVRGVLRLPVSPFTIRSSLFDMTGGQVMALHPGANDVSGLAPGVYFVRALAGRARSAVRKVVVAR